MVRLINLYCFLWWPNGKEEEEGSILFKTAHVSAGGSSCLSGLEAKHSQPWLLFRWETTRESQDSRLKWNSKNIPEETNGKSLPQWYNNYVGNKCGPIPQVPRNWPPLEGGGFLTSKIDSKLAIPLKKSGGNSRVSIHQFSKGILFKALGRVDCWSLYYDFPWHFSACCSEFLRWTPCKAQKSLLPNYMYTSLIDLSDIT